MWAAAPVAQTSKALRVMSSQRNAHDPALLCVYRGLQAPPKVLIPDEAASADPDNVPPRSRLFLVVPKTAEARLVHVSIQLHLAAAATPAAPLSSCQLREHDICL